MAVSGGGVRRPHALVRHAALAHRRVSRLPPTLRGLLWSGGAGLVLHLLHLFDTTAQHCHVGRKHSLHEQLVGNHIDELKGRELFCLEPGT